MRCNYVSFSISQTINKRLHLRVRNRRTKELKNYHEATEIVEKRHVLYIMARSVRWMKQPCNTGVTSVYFESDYRYAPTLEAKHFETTLCLEGAPKLLYKRRQDDRGPNIHVSKVVRRVLFSRTFSYRTLGFFCDELRNDVRLDLFLLDLRGDVIYNV